MLKNETNGITYYTFENLSKESGINHLFSTRLGGVSKGHFASMNLGYKGDNAENVDENYNRIASLGFPRENMVFANQIHSTNIKRIYSKTDDTSNTDGLMTNIPGIVLVTFHADCVPLYFYDPVKKAIALSHSGWRGSVAGMAKITIERMKEEFGSDPSDILVGIGPSICKNCYEVGSELSSEGFLDLWEINKQNLLEAGVLNENIELPNICTKCNPDIFFSHRVMGSLRGTMAAFLTISSSFRA